jgi:uncharacterized membrane protein YGL010W
MSALERHLASYAAYHRDRRNIVAHAFGIPMIVFAALVLLSRPAFEFFPFSHALPFSAAVAVAAIAAGWYIGLDIGLGLAMTLALGLGLALATPLAGGSRVVWLASGIGTFVIGWVFQFVGHAFEGRKPAFADDLLSLMVGPLFMMAELFFALGGKRELEAAIERKAGPTRVGREISKTA